MIISSTKFFQFRSVQLFQKIQRHPTIILLSRKIKYSITEIGFSSIRTRIYTTSTPRLGKTRELLGRRSSWTRISSNTRSKSCRTRGCKRSEAHKRIPCRVVASSESLFSLPKRTYCERTCHQLQLQFLFSFSLDQPSLFPVPCERYLL